jgi:hypothetical protein
MQFAAERIVIAEFAMVGFGMRIRCSANILKTRFR